MAKPCPGCGAATVPEARFCRLCGAPLKTGNARDANAPVSPLAQTIPLTGEGRATDGLSADESRRSSSDTSRVGRTEMENILRRAAAAHSDPLNDGNGEKATQQTTTLDSSQPLPTESSTATPAAATAVAASSSTTTPPASITDAQPPSASARARRLWQVAAIALLCVALVAGALAFILSRRAGSVDSEVASAPISISDQKQLVAEKLAEAEVLLAGGEFNRAINVLRSAVKLDPSSAEAHMRLGDALEKTGARTEAIDEYSAAAQSRPDDPEAWRSLAAAQFAEKLYSESAESYRRGIEATGEKGADDEMRLNYADALRQAGRVDEARAAYQKITSSAQPAIAQVARERLAELGPVTTNNDRAKDDNRAAGGQAETEGAVAQPAPTLAPTPTPQARTTPSTATAPSSAQGDADANYFRAMNIVNGRDARNLSDGELAAALNYFLRAQGGAHSAEASRQAERLGREYDRRRKR